MKILIVSQYFWPETFIINDLVTTWAQQGHTVKVLTGKPNYPDGEVFAGYEQDGSAEEVFGANVKVFRAPLRPRGRSSAVNLVRNYLSFIVNGCRYFGSAVRGESYDFILVFAPSPITSVIPAIYLKWKMKTHLAVWVQDLWPDSLEATGFIKNKAVLSVVSLLVRAIYKCTDTLLAQSQAFMPEIARFARPDKIVYYPNSYLQPAGETRDDQVPADLLEMMEQHFCMVFAGNLGTAQSVETIIAAAERLKHVAAIKLVVVGSGSLFEYMSEEKARLDLHNLVLPGRFHGSAMPQFYRRAGGLLVTLKRSRIFSLTVPSKVQAYMAAGVPIVAALDGEGARIIEQARAGLSCAAEDAVALSVCIEKLFNMPADERAALGHAGRVYFEEHFEMERQAQNLVEIMQRRI